jgi:hypothetical protein
MSKGNPGVDLSPVVSCREDLSTGQDRWGGLTSVLLVVKSGEWGGTPLKTGPSRGSRKVKMSRETCVSLSHVAHYLEAFPSP